MNDERNDDEPNEASRKLGESFATAIGQSVWSLDNSEALLEGKLPESEAQVVPEPEESPPAPQTKSWLPPESEIPPRPRQIVEALLFVSREPVSLEAMASSIRGLTPRLVLAEIDELNRMYAQERRPYRIAPKGKGYRLEVLPEFQRVRDRLRASEREIALPQPALEVLSLIAYRQPIDKPELDELRGGECGPILRQLTRHGLIAASVREAERGKVSSFSTTNRFLEMFGLRMLEDLPRLGEAEPR